VILIFLESRAQSVGGLPIVRPAVNQAAYFGVVHADYVRFVIVVQAS
jgi:hypothetical protein